MGRLCPFGFKRFRQTLPGDLNFTFAGAETNVAPSISMLGGAAWFVTALPKHDITEACLANLRGLGVDTSGIVKTDTGRLGLYWGEEIKKKGVRTVLAVHSIVLTPFSCVTTFRAPNQGVFHDTS